MFDRLPRLTICLKAAKHVFRTRRRRIVVGFFGARNRSEHILKEHLEKVAGENDNVRLHVCYSRPGREDVKGRDYTHEGRVTFISSQAEFTPKQIQTHEERVKLVYRIKIEVENPRRELKSNMPADAEIRLEP